MNLDLSKIHDIKFGGVYADDYPDFVDSYIIEAVYPTVKNPVSGNKEHWRYLTFKEIDYLNESADDKIQDWKYQKLIDWIY